MIALALALGFVAGVLFVAVGAFALLWYETRGEFAPPPRSRWAAPRMRHCGRCGSMFGPDAWHTCPRERARPS